ncbi:MAG: alpha/beta fold hydrolase [Anaerolineales bacterium]|nr:alpha/beta fold hydrolase [Anaerolineales bacterium]
MPKVHANGVELYYELHGSETAPLLVLNNGIIMNAATSWAFQTKTLAQHYRILQYDCRGQGQSEHPGRPYSMEMHADDLAALLTALNVDKAHIAGISYGGEVAQAFGLKYPGRTLGLILADTVSEVGAETRIIVDGWLDSCARADSTPFSMPLSRGIFLQNSSPPIRVCSKTPKAATSCWTFHLLSVCAKVF